MIVSEVNVYPVKSCGGIALDAASIGERGFVNDRRWMLLDERGSMITQREAPTMALIKTAVDDHALRLSAPGRPDFALPLDQPGERVAVTIWRDKGVGAVEQGAAVAAWFSDYLGQPAHLVRFAADFVRHVDIAYAHAATDQVGFADGYPFLILSEESLADLNTRLDQPLPMNRFRPNIVVRGADKPYAEDDWQTIRIGDVIFDVVKACARCAITTTDQATAERGKEPLHTLATYRIVRKSGPVFGQNAIHRSTGVIHVGDAVEVLE